MSNIILIALYFLATILFIGLTLNIVFYGVYGIYFLANKIAWEKGRFLKWVYLANGTPKEKAYKEIAISAIKHIRHKNQRKRMLEMLENIEEGE